MNCYIAECGKQQIPQGITKDNCIFFPEAGMTTRELWTSARPRDFHIMTDSAVLVSLYDRREVFIYDEERGWINPDIQTYGAAVDHILLNIWNLTYSQNHTVIDSKLATNCLGSPLDTKAQ